MADQRPSFIVGIGGSAGALNSYKALLEALPGDTGMAFVIVSHMMPNASSELALILSMHTTMPVLVASAGMEIRKDHVYVSPPNVDLRIVNFSFQVLSPRTERNKEIDLFLISLAASMGARAVGIIVSGYNGDGTEGCKQIKANGGTTLAQDDSAEVNEMPVSAYRAGGIDFVLALDAMPKALKQLAQTVTSKR